MTTIKLVDFYCLAHTIITCQPSGEDDITSLWVAACESGTSLPVLLIDKKPYWRTSVYPDYKGNRNKTKDATLDKIVNIGMRLPYPSMMIPGLEADDLAGLWCHYHTNLGSYNTGIELLTTDTDWLQLVSDTNDIRWVNYGKHLPRTRRNKEVLNWAWQRFSMLITKPSQIALVKRVLGDSGDNVPKDLDIDLVSLQGKSWLYTLADSGYDVDSLLAQIGEIYDRVTHRVAV